MRDKAAVGADLYIEDAPENIEQLRTDGHPTIVFSNSTNLHLDGPRAASWKDVESLVLNELGAWRQAQQGGRKQLSGE